MDGTATGYNNETIGERLEHDRPALQVLPATAIDACDKRPGRVSSLSLVRNRGPDVPLIATNGIRDGDDVARALLSGAAAAEMSTAVMTGGFATLTRAIDALAAYLEAKRIDATDLIGNAADQTKRFQDLPVAADNRLKVIPPAGR